MKKKYLPPLTQTTAVHHGELLGNSGVRNDGTKIIDGSTNYMGNEEGDGSDAGAKNGGWDLWSNDVWGILLAIAMMWTTAVQAQVESPNTPTILDATWTEVDDPSAESFADLHFAGPSVVKYTVEDITAFSSSHRDYSYIAILEVRREDGTVKGKKYYKCTATYQRSGWTWNRTVNFQESTDGTTWGSSHAGATIDGEIEIAQGETGDHLYMEIYGGNGEVILNALSTISTRYDIYDDKPLFGDDTSTDIRSNRIKDHPEKIDVYVHRTLQGDGAWSTLCLPFDMSHAQMKNTFGNAVVYSEFTSVDLEHGFIDFTSTQNGIKAGKPYLIQNNGATITNFFADDVMFTVESVKEANNNRQSDNQSQGYWYVGLLEPTAVNSDEEELFNPDGTAVYIATAEDGAQHLKRLSDDGSIKAFRAYLRFPATDTSQNDMMLINLDNMQNPESTGVIRINDGKRPDVRVYNLHGEIVGTDIDHLPRGVYIHQGKKIMIK